MRLICSLKDMLWGRIDPQFIMGAVSSQIQTSLRELRTYLERLERDLVTRDRGEALAKPQSASKSEILEQFRKPLTVQIRVPNGRSDRPMPEIPLNDPNIGSFVDESITATVPQHV
jgi:hypothetical protein